MDDLKGQVLIGMDGLMNGWDGPQRVNRCGRGNAPTLPFGWTSGIVMVCVWYPMNAHIAKYYVYCAWVSTEAEMDSGREKRSRRRRGRKLQDGIGQSGKTARMKTSMAFNRYDSKPMR